MLVGLSYGARTGSLAYPLPHYRAHVGAITLGAGCAVTLLWRDA